MSITVYIFDFDCTITYRNFAYFWWKPDTVFKELYPEINNNTINDLSTKFNNNQLTSRLDKQLFNNIIFGSTTRINELDNLFDKLSKKGNLIISSRGNADKIYECLQLNKLGKYFSRYNIYGTETNKTLLIKNRLDSAHTVFYIDDNHEEHLELNPYNKLIYTDSNFKMYLYLKNRSRYIFCYSLIKNNNGLDTDLMIKIDQFI